MFSHRQSRGLGYGLLAPGGSTPCAAPRTESPEAKSQQHFPWYTSVELLPGTLDLLILRALRWEPTHGSGVAVWLRMVTDSGLVIEEGTLYPALHRLERRGLITSEWGPSEKNRRARHYQLTAQGRAHFRDQADAWARYAEMMDRVLRYGATGGIRGR